MSQLLYYGWAWGVGYYSKEELRELRRAVDETSVVVGTQMTLGKRIVLLPKNHLILPDLNANCPLFLGVRASWKEELDKWLVRHYKYDLMHVYKRFPYLLVDFKRERILVMNGSGLERVGDARGRLLSEMLKDDIQRFSDLVKSVVSRKLIDLRDFNDVTLSQTSFPWKDTFKIMRVSGALLIVVDERDGKRTLTVASSKAAKPYLSDEAKKGPLSLTESSSEFYAWQSSFKTIFSVEISGDEMRKKLSETIVMAFRNVINDQHKNRIEELFSMSSFRLYIENLMEREESLLLSLLFTFGAIYGSKTKKIFNSIKLPIDVCKSINVSYRNDKIRCFLESMLVTLGVMRHLGINIDFPWVFVPYEIDKGRVTKLVLCNKLLNVGLIFDEQKLIDVIPKDNVFSEFFSKRIFVDDMSIGDVIVEYLIANDVFEEVEMELKKTLLFNVLKSMKVRRFENCKIVEASAKFGTKKLREAWKEYKRVRRESILKRLETQRFAKKKIKDIERMIREVEEEEDKKIKNFISTALEKLNKSKLVIDHPDEVPVYNFLTKFYEK